jgi:hypothetical protein
MIASLEQKVQGQTLPLSKASTVRSMVFPFPVTETALNLEEYLTLRNISKVNTLDTSSSCWWWAGGNCLSELLQSWTGLQA